MLAKAFDWFIMGLCFGMGFMLAYAAIRFIVNFLSQAHPVALP